jgi:hypothetical protein
LNDRIKRRIRVIRRTLIAHPDMRLGRDRRA